MLSVSLMKGGSGEYYINLAREDYYQRGGEPPGRWLGSGAETIGLSGELNKDDLRQLLSGFSLDGEKMVQSAGTERHRSGWDLTFSAPKTVSVIWSQAAPEIRKQIQDAQFQAVERALGYLEDNAAITRLGRDGVEEEKAKLIVATFEHGTSRAQDPQLHTHALVLNACLREDGSTGTIQSRYLYKHQMAAGAIYRAELAKELEQKLGLEAVRKKNWFELDGVSPKLVTELSKRRAEIEQRLSAKGFESAKAAEISALDTRQKKEELPRAELFERWQEIGREHGFGPEKAAKLLAASPPKRNYEQEIEAATHTALERLTDHHSHFTERDLLRHLAEEAQGRGIGAKEIRTRVEQEIRQSPELISLGRSRRELRFTTKEMLELEESMLERVGVLQKDTTHQLNNDLLERVLSKRPSISEEQAESVRHITRTPGAIQVVSGMAGTGKTYMLETANTAWALAGKRVNGLTLAGKAAQGLEEGSGIASDTIHSTLLRIKSGQLEVDRNTVLVVDEAGMVGTRQMAELVKLTHSSGAKLVLIGDSRQLQPVNAGGPFSAIAKRIGQSELNTIRRQNEPWAREAVKQFADGEGGKALTEYAKRGLVTVTKDRDEAMSGLIAEWKKKGAQQPEQNLIIAGANAEARLLNQLAQAERKHSRQLGEKKVEVGGVEFHAGDRVLFTRNARIFGVKNGTLGTIEEVQQRKKRLSIRLDSGARTLIPLKTYEHVKLGYAITTHKGQGVTVDNAYILAGGAMQDRELSYVQASRARGETKFFVDELEAGEKLKDLARSMERSRKKDLAVDVREIRRRVEIGISR